MPTDNSMQDLAFIWKIVVMWPSFFPITDIPIKSVLDRVSWTGEWKKRHCYVCFLFTHPIGWLGPQKISSEVLYVLVVRCLCISWLVSRFLWVCCCPRASGDSWHGELAGFQLHGRPCPCPQCGWEMRTMTVLPRLEPMLALATQLVGVPIGQY